MSLKSVQNWKLCLILTVAVATVVVAVWQSEYLWGGDTRREASAQQAMRESVAEGQAIYADYRYVSLNTPDSAASIREAFELERAGLEPAILEDFDQLAEFVSGLLYYRLVANDPAQYRIYMEQNGYRFGDPEYLNTLQIPYDYQYFFEEEYPGDEHLDEVWGRLFQRSMTDSGMRFDPVSVAADARGIGIAVGEMCEASMGEWPQALGDDSTPQWHGSYGGAFRNWFLPPFGIWHKEVVRRGCVEAAMFTCVIGFDKDDAYPLSFGFIRPKGTRQWWLVNVGVSNSAFDRFTMVEW